jgi:hypothetical protein
LSANSRRDIWRTFLSKVTPIEGFEWLNDASLGLLAAENLSGRQIKNTTRTAYSLAPGTGEALAMSHITAALKALKRFEEDVENDRRAGELTEDEDEDISSGSRKRRRITEP